MNLRQLGYFLQIAELRSFTRAASVLHVSQPSLSRQMQALEQELGVLLFVRSDKGVQLTDAGVTLRDRADAALQLVRQIRDEIGQQSKAPQGELTFGMPPSLFDFLTVPLVCAFSGLYPAVQLQVTEGVSATMHELVVTGRLDAAVISDAEPLDQLRSQPLVSEQLFLVGPGDAGLDIATPMPVAGLAERPLILTSRPNAMRMIVDRALAGSGHRVAPVLVANSSRLLSGLVAAGTGFTVLPFSAVGEVFAAGRVSLAPIAGLRVGWTFVTARDRSLSLAGQKLRDLALELARDGVSSGSWRGAAPLD